MDAQFYDFEVLVSDPTLSIDQVVDASDDIYIEIVNEPRIVSADGFYNGNKSFTFVVGTEILTHDEVADVVHKAIASKYGSDFIIIEH